MVALGVVRAGADELLRPRTPTSCHLVRAGGDDGHPPVAHKDAQVAELPIASAFEYLATSAPTGPGALLVFRIR